MVRSENRCFGTGSKSAIHSGIQAPGTLSQWRCWPSFVVRTEAHSATFYCNATAAPANAAGSDQAQSPKYIRAAVARTQPTKKPARR